MGGNGSPSHILITGASSGLGAALARATARPGATLSLGGRDAARLACVAAACADRGADVRTTVADVTDRAAMRRWIDDADAARPLDLVIANAGVSAGTGSGGETGEQSHRIFAVNVDGVINTVLPSAVCMKRREKGNIAIMSSLAGFTGLRGAPAYCASKAAVRIWGEALRAELRPAGIGVFVICPGFVRTPMTDANRFPMPFLMDADRAAGIILGGIARNRGLIAFPLPMYLGVRLFAALPARLKNAISGGLPQKRADAR